MLPKPAKYAQRVSKYSARRSMDQPRWIQLYLWARQAAADRARRECSRGGGGAGVRGAPQRRWSDRVLKAVVGVEPAKQHKTDRRTREWHQQDAHAHHEKDGHHNRSENGVGQGGDAGQPHRVTAADCSQGHRESHESGTAAGRAHPGKTYGSLEGCAAGGRRASSRRNSSSASSWYRLALHRKLMQ